MRWTCWRRPPQAKTDRVAAMTTGQFLDSFHISGSVEFEEWVGRTRARLVSTGYRLVVDPGVQVFEITPEGAKREDEAAPPGAHALMRLIGTVALLAVVVGVAWWLRSGVAQAPGTGSLSVGLELDRDAVAVFPFRVSASDGSVLGLREGMLDLLYAKFTGSPGREPFIQEPAYRPGGRGPPTMRTTYRWTTSSRWAWR